MPSERSTTGFCFSGTRYAKRYSGNVQNLLSYSNLDIGQIAALTYEEAADTLALTPGDLTKNEHGKVKELAISIAAHSSLMEPARKRMRILLRDEIIEDPKVAFIQNVTADYATTAEQVRRGLIDQVTGRVLWMDTVRRMRVDGVGEFIEVGPGKVLSGLIKRIDPNAITSHVEDKLVGK